MQFMRRAGSPAAVVTAGLLFVGGCTTVSYESYRPVANRTVDIAYVAQSADFSRYKRLLPEEMGIFYPSHAPVSEDDLAEVRRLFQDAFRAQVADYEIVSRAAPDVLTVRASLVDLRNTLVDRLPNIADDLNAILEPGKLTFLIEMRDSVTGDLLLRAADTQKSPSLDLPAGGTADVRAAAEYWAGLFRAFLDRNLSARTGDTD